MAQNDRRTAILLAARESFTTRGYDGTAIGAVAKDLGISKAAITYYFPAKSDFLTVLLGPLISDLADIARRTTTAPWPTGPRRLLRDYLQVLAASADLARWVDTDPALRLENRPGCVVRDLDRRLAERIIQSSPLASNRLRALTVIGGIWRPLHHTSGNEIQGQVDEIVDAALISYAPLVSEA